ncbi:MAG: sigma-70 family RNA polymerase sigma factor [Anaerolineales bacterium]|jgi:RNA polymerase primary sigma factor
MDTQSTRRFRDEYIEQITQTPLLTAEEEISLSQDLARARKARRRLAQGGLSESEERRLRHVIEEGSLARERLIMANTRLVVSVAKRYTNRGIPLMDLIHEGIIGLIRATKKFDPSRGNRFSTYATWWIRQAITRSIDNTSRTIRLPVHKSVEINKLLQARNRLTQSLGREPNDLELAGELGTTPQLVQETINISQAPISLDLPQDDDENRTLGDTIPDLEVETPEGTAVENLMQQQVRDVLDALPAREAQVLMLRYGFTDGRSHTLQEVGDKLGITRERVRQIEMQAMSRIRSDARRIR